MPIPPSPIQVTLRLRGHDRSVPADLEFRNTSKKSAYLYKFAACAGGIIKNNLFVIQGKDGKVPYVGRYFRRPPPRMPEDFIEIVSGATYVTQVHLGEVYEFPRGGGQYRVRYEAIDPSRTETGDLREMKSEDVIFTLSP